MENPAHTTYEAGFSINNMPRQVYVGIERIIQQFIIKYSANSHDIHSIAINIERLRDEKVDVE